MVRQGDVLSYAFTRLNETGLRAQGWRFKINTNKARLGVCKYNIRRIEVSLHILEKGMDQVKDTINHEIAHAIVGPGHKHNHVWKAKALELGCNGERCGSMAHVREKALWVGICPVGHKVYRHRLKNASTRSSCYDCCSHFDERYLLKWERNGA